MRKKTFPVLCFVLSSANRNVDIWYKIVMCFLCDSVMYAISHACDALTKLAFSFLLYVGSGTLERIFVLFVTWRFNELWNSFNCHFFSTKATTTFCDYTHLLLCARANLWPSIASWLLAYWKTSGLSGALYLWRSECTKLFALCLRILTCVKKKTDGVWHGVRIKHWI